LAKKFNHRIEDPLDAKLLIPFNPEFSVSLLREQKREARMKMTSSLPEGKARQLIIYKRIQIGHHCGNNTHGKIYAVIVRESARIS